MPDTGAPWNIPYVESADLVSDWPADSLLVANAVAAGLSAAGNAGIGSNVVQTVKTDTFTTTSTSMVSVTGLSASITPTSASSKVLIIVTGLAGHSGTMERIDVDLMRDSTAIGQAVGGNGGRTLTIYTAPGDSTFGEAFAISFVDSPATTSSITYSIEISTPAGTAYIGRPGVSDRRSSTSIAAIEVAA